MSSKQFLGIAFVSLGGLLGCSDETPVGYALAPVGSQATVSEPVPPPQPVPVPPPQPVPGLPPAPRPGQLTQPLPTPSVPVQFGTPPTPLPPCPPVVVGPPGPGGTPPPAVSPGQGTAPPGPAVVPPPASGPNCASPRVPLPASSPFANCDLFGDLSPITGSDLMRGSLHGRWLLCSEQGLMNQEQVGLEISKLGTFVLLETDAQGALVPKQGPAFEGTFECGNASGQSRGGYSIRCDFRSNQGGEAVISYPLITVRPVGLRITNGPFDYRYIRVE
jgi:hypothetical protein